MLLFAAGPPARVTMRRSKRRRMRRSDLVDIEAEMPFRLSNTAMRSWNQQSAGPACRTSQNLFNDPPPPCWPVVALRKGSPLHVHRDGARPPTGKRTKLAPCKISWLTTRPKSTLVSIYLFIYFKLWLWQKENLKTKNKIWLQFQKKHYYHSSSDN